MQPPHRHQHQHRHHHHHHHHHHHCFVCPCRCRPHHHHHHHPIPHNPSCPNFIPIPPQLQHPISPAAPGAQKSELSAGDDAAAASANGLRRQDWGDGVEVDDEDEDVMFVLTDEWKEFFAKSEAKRRLKKQQRRKGSR